eukprot:scaffold6460_cov130-Isochrysis_galbana.AAC.9
MVEERRSEDGSMKAYGRSRRCDATCNMRDCGAHAWCLLLAGGTPSRWIAPSTLCPAGRHAAALARGAFARPLYTTHPRAHSPYLGSRAL